MFTDVGINQKCACDLLLVINSYGGTAIKAQLLLWNSAATAVSNMLLKLLSLNAFAQGEPFQTSRWILTGKDQNPDVHILHWRFYDSS